MDFLKGIVKRISDKKNELRIRKPEKENGIEEEWEEGARLRGETEGIRCDTRQDLAAVNQIIQACTANQRIPASANVSLGELSGYLDNEALVAVDTNVASLGQAIIAQNFMLMRKIEALGERLAELEKSCPRSQELEP